MRQSPQTTPDFVAFRGPTSSEKHNEQEQQMFQDLVALYGSHEERREAMREIHQTMHHEQKAMERHIEALEERMEALMQEMDQLQSEKAGRFTVASFLEEAETGKIDGVENADVDYTYREIVPPVTQGTSRLFHEGEDGTRIIPSTLDIDISESGGVSEENDFRYALNGEDGDAWRRSVRYQQASAPSEEICTITIELPERLAIDKRVNRISLDPHPAYETEVAGIEVEEEGAWVPVLTTPFKGKRHHRIAPKATKRIRITLKQSSFRMIYGEAVFSLGLNECDIGFDRHDREGGSIFFPFSMDAHLPYTIEEIEPVFMNMEALHASAWNWQLMEKKVMETDLYYEENDELYPLLEADYSMSTRSKLWAKITVYPDPVTHAAPSISGARLHVVKE